jgi:hypothetical protein
MLWIDDYMTPKDKEWVAWVKKNRVAMSKGGQAASSQVYYSLF